MWREAGEVSREEDQLLKLNPGYANVETPSDMQCVRFSTTNRTSSFCKCVFLTYLLTYLQSYLDGRFIDRRLEADFARPIILNNYNDAQRRVSVEN